MAQLEALLSFLWSGPVAAGLLGTGLWFTLHLRFGQIRLLPLWLSHAKRPTAQSPDRLSPFAALCSALGGSMGTGNIAGVATALQLGGPGALLWMWVSAALGMATKYAEVALNLKYRRCLPNREIECGAMYVLEQGLGKRFRPLACIFALAGSLAAFFTGNLTQISAVFSSLPNLSALGKIALGILFLLAVAPAVMGGVRSIGRFSQIVVPFAGLLFSLLCLICILANLSSLGEIFQRIWQDAWNLKSAGGAVAGQALRYGLARGIFSHEAGMGSTVILHAQSSQNDPAGQGLLGMAEVFLDTFVGCTLTGLALLCTRTSDMLQALSCVFGGVTASVCLPLLLCLFAYSTLVSWSEIGCKCFTYLFGASAKKLYLSLFLAVIPLGAFLNTWLLTDLCNALMAIPNMLCLFLLRKEVPRLPRIQKPLI